MKRLLIPALTLTAALLFADAAEARPLRNGAKRALSGVRSVAGRVTDVLPFGVCWRKRANSPGKPEGSKCAGGVCR